MLPLRNVKKALALQNAGISFKDLDTPETPNYSAFVTYKDWFSAAYQKDGKGDRKSTQKINQKGIVCDALGFSGNKYYKTCSALQSKVQWDRSTMLLACRLPHVSPGIAQLQGTPVTRLGNGSLPVTLEAALTSSGYK